MNGRDALVLARPNGMLVDVSNLEGTPFFLPLSLRENSFLITFFFIWYSMEGVWEGFFTVCLVS